MGKENQDYFKVGGRSGGPAGSLRGFKERFAQEQARTHRLESGRLPHERRPAGARSPATFGGAGERFPQEPQETATPSPAAEDRSPVPGEEGGQAMRRDAGSAREGATHAPPAGETSASRTLEGSRGEPGDASAAPGRRRGAPKRPSFPAASTAGFGPPASEEMAVGGRVVHGGHAPGHETPFLLRQAARRFPLPFRMVAGIERVFDKRIRRALDERIFLSIVERKMRRPIARSLDMVQFLGKTAKSAKRSARH